MEKRKKLPKMNYLWLFFQGSQLKIPLVVVTMKLVHLKKVRVTNLLKAGVLDIDNVINWERIKISGHQHSAFYVKNHAVI